MSAEQTNYPKQAFVRKGDRPEVRSTQDHPSINLDLRDAGQGSDDRLSRKHALEEASSGVENRPVFYKRNEKHWYELTLPSVDPKEEKIEELFESFILGVLRTTSPNWSGALCLRRHPIDPIDSVWATWVVPKVKPLANDLGSGDWRSASWVGLDGGIYKGSGDVLQAGIDQKVTRGPEGRITEEYEAWYAWDSGADPNKHPIDVPIEAGDLVYVKVQFLNPGGLVHFINYTRGYDKRIPISKPGSVQFIGDSAEWVMERPCSDPVKETYYQLADFGVMEFFHCGALTRNGISIIRGRCLVDMEEKEPYRILSESSPDTDDVRIAWKAPA